MITRFKAQQLADQIFNIKVVSRRVALFATQLMNCLIYHLYVKCYQDREIKVAFNQKGLIRSSFPQRDEPNYFPELKF